MHRAALMLHHVVGYGNRPGHPSSAERCRLRAIEKMTIQWRAILPLFLGAAITGSRRIDCRSPGLAASKPFCRFRTDPLWINCLDCLFFELWIRLRKTRVIALHIILENLQLNPK